MEESMLEKAEFASEHIKGITAWSKKIENSHNQHFIETLEATGRKPNLFSLISWERLLLDIHSGRVLGSLGVVLVDLMALLFMLMAASGVWIWSRRRN